MRTNNRCKYANGSRVFKHYISDDEKIAFDKDFENEKTYLE